MTTREAHASRLSPATLARATRAVSLTAGAIPVIVAAALAWGEGRPVDGLCFGLLLLGVCAAQAAVNLVNDYFDDASGLDADPEFADSPFPQGSRVLQSGEVSRRGMAVLAAACFGVAGLAGVALLLRTGEPGVIALAATGGLLGYFYTAPPLRLAYRGLGEPVIFLLFGPLAGAGSYWVLTGQVTVASLATATIVGLLTLAILYLHHFPQHDADRRHAKRTPVVRLGPARAGRLVAPLLALPFVIGLAAAGAGALPWLAALLPLAVLPSAFAAGRIAWQRPEVPEAMARAFAHVFLLHLGGGLLLSAALALA